MIDSLNNPRPGERWILPGDRIVRIIFVDESMVVFATNKSKERILLHEDFKAKLLLPDKSLENTFWKSKNDSLEYVDEVTREALDFLVLTRYTLTERNKPLAETRLKIDLVDYLKQHERAVLPDRRESWFEKKTGEQAMIVQVFRDEVIFNTEREKLLSAYSLVDFLLEYSYSGKMTVWQRLENM